MDEQPDGKIGLIIEFDPQTRKWQWGFTAEVNIEDFIGPTFSVAQEMATLRNLQRRQEQAKEQPKIMLPSGPLPRHPH